MAFGAGPEEICNRALDSLGYAGVPIGDMEEGGTVASAALRIYKPLRQQLLRAAHWGFARRLAPLTLLQDITGQTTLTNPAVGTGTPGMLGWIYEYAWPTDGIAARWSPLNWQPFGQQIPGNINLPATALMPTLGTPSQVPRMVPTRFLVTTDIVPTLTGAITSWDQVPDYANIQGRAPAQQTVVLSNQQNALLVYTADIEPPDLWDPLFQQAAVAAIAAALAMVAIPDKKFAMQMRRDQTALARAALEQARIRDGNEGVSTTSNIPDWIRTRNVLNSGWGGFGSWNGLGQGWDGDSGGVWGYGWSQFSGSDGGAF